MSVCEEDGTCIRLAGLSELRVIQSWCRSATADTLLATARIERQGFGRLDGLRKWGLTQAGWAATLCRCGQAGLWNFRMMSVNDRQLSRIARLHNFLLLEEALRRGDWPQSLLPFLPIALPAHAESHEIIHFKIS